MMDMEMNAELERDGGSEEGEASTSGSSAGSVYCSLEQDYSRICKEMKDNDELASYMGEYTRLFEALYKAHQQERDLTDQCTTLKEVVSENTRKISELEGQVKANMNSMDRLNSDIVEGKRLADAAHTREQRAQEVIENLRVSIAKLSDELDQKNKLLVMGEQSAASKDTEGLTRDRERLIGEVETLKQRLKTLTEYKQELDQKLSESEQQMAELQEKLDRQTNDTSKERREREKLETDFQLLQEEFRLRVADLETAEETLKTSLANASKQESILRDQVQENEKNQKEIQKLMLKQMAMKTEADKLALRNEKYRKEMGEKNKYSRELAKEIQELKETLAKVRSEKENAMKKLILEKGLSAKTEENLTRVTMNLRNADLEIASLKHHLDVARKTGEKLGREKDAAFKAITLLEDANKKLTLETRVLEQTNRKMETSLEELQESKNDLNRQVTNIEKERDRGILEAKELAMQVEDYIDEVKMKRLEITDYQKRLAEGDAKFRQQQQLFEDIRAERNTYKKNLSIAQEEISELKNKMKNLNMQMDILKEQLQEKDSLLTKQEFLFSKVEKEKDTLKAELANCRKSVSDLRHELEQMRQEEKSLRSALQSADTTIIRQRKEIESVLNERDVIGTQIVRRNDELSLQYSKIQTLTETLTRGEKQYAQRMEEIRALKLEVKRLRTEKEALEKTAASLGDLRGEVFHLERHLTRERLKVTALEEEVQNPLNVHRWRNLEGTDPDTFELLQKTQILQKRILKMSSEMIEKEKKIRETEKLYMNLRELVAKQPGPEVLLYLNKTRRALKDRGKKMKCLVAELNMTMSTEHKFEIERIKRELNIMKSKYLSQKKKHMKCIETAKENLPVTSESGPTTKIFGGGFNTSTVSSKTAPLITINQ